MPRMRVAGWSRFVVAILIGLAAAGCEETSAPAGAVAELAASVEPGVHRQYGTPVKVGQGMARAYVLLDQKTKTPLEVGVAFDERALEGLPEPMPGHAHDMHEFLLPLPPQAPATYRFVELDWNPQGHTPPFHPQPHFDVHFYITSVEQRNAIDPADPLFLQRAANFPAPEFIPPGYGSPSVLFGLPIADVAVPRMGVHWIDPTSPEYPPQLQPFTHTFIIGTWDGRVTFYEPMVTREFMQNVRSGAAPPLHKSVSVAQQHEPAGHYPDGYSVVWDATKKEYRIAITGLAWRE